MTEAERMTEAGQIQQEFSRAAGRITASYQDELDRLRNNAAASDEERIDHAYDAHGRAGQDYRQAVEERNAKFTEREAEIREDLFGAPSGSAGLRQSFTQALLKARETGDEELSELAGLAADTGDETLGKAVFAVAARRGRTDIALPYLNANPEARALFRELSEMPTPEERERAAGVSIPAPRLDSVRASSEALASARRIEDLERGERSRRVMGG